MLSRHTARGRAGTECICGGTTQEDVHADLNHSAPLKPNCPASLQSYAACVKKLGQMAGCAGNQTWAWQRIALRAPHQAYLVPLRSRDPVNRLPFDSMRQEKECCRLAVAVAGLAVGVGGGC